jgi:hypothetical protein
VASDGRELWGVTDTALVHWSNARRRWTPGLPLLRDEVGEDFLGLAVAGGQPVVVHHGRIVLRTPGGLQAIQVPVLHGDPHVRLGGIELNDLFTDERAVWIACGYGEWGGNLLALDRASERWSEYTDESHFPNGLNAEADGQVLAAWSMSQLGTMDTLLRAHRADVAVQHRLPIPGRHDFEKIARSANGRTLYAIDVGIERSWPVVVRGGRPVRLALPPNREDRAQPGITRLLPTDGGELVVIWRNEPPLVYHTGRLIRLPFRPPGSGSPTTRGADEDGEA